MSNFMKTIEDREILEICIVVLFLKLLFYNFDIKVKTHHFYVSFFSYCILHITRDGD
jgi:hypothetical protein